MKKIIAVLCLGVVLSSNAATQKRYAHPSETEITQNRSCFENLEVQGCRTIEEDPEQFRSCMSSALDSLEDHCKKMFLKLYGNQ